MSSLLYMVGNLVAIPTAKNDVVWAYFPVYYFGLMFLYSHNLHEKSSSKFFDEKI